MGATTNSLDAMIAASDHHRALLENGVIAPEIEAAT